MCSSHCSKDVSIRDSRRGNSADPICKRLGRLVSVAHDEAAVDVDRLARHVVGVAASEKAYDASHVLRSFGSAERDKRGSPLPGLTDLPALDFAPLGVDLPPHW